MKPVVISVVGPTAIGKSKLGIEIAKHYDGEIISGDSMQIYREMNIGTAKVTKEEMEGIHHHMIDIKDPNEPFSVAEFQSRVQTLIYDITERGHLPILVGGTGLYIQATLFDFNFSNQGKDEKVVMRLEEELNKIGMERMHQRLKDIDPRQAERIHPNNYRRVLRALEIYETTGQTMSAYLEQQSDNSPFKPVLIGLEMERQLLYDRINRRVDDMLEEGLIQEVKGLYDRGLEDQQSLKAIGYKEFVPYFKGDYDLERAIELLKRNSRRYAKRQYTYFKNKMDVDWYTITETNYQTNFETILEDLAGKIE